MTECVNSAVSVVANHEICHYGYTWEVAEETWDEILSVNLTGVWKVLKAVSPVLIDQATEGQSLSRAR
jgi:NAD(P)-dependent dehydrogenase (short-subunit alcohol dehydrogenase family)